MRKISYLILLLAIICTSCGMSNKITRGTQYSMMYEETPLTLLVMPPINNTTNVEAKDLLYTSISKPLAEAGYYIISPMLAMDILKQESAYDSELFVNGNLSVFKNFFGADAVIFSQIDKWTKKGFTIQTTIRYFIKSSSTGEILFDRSCELTLDLSQNSGNTSLLGQLVDLTTSALATALTDHIIAARKANNYIFMDIPRGKYSPNYLQDKDVIAMPKDIKARVK